MYSFINIGRGSLMLREPSIVVRRATTTRRLRLRGDLIQ